MLLYTLGDLLAFLAFFFFFNTEEGAFVGAADGASVGLALGAGKLCEQAMIRKWLAMPLTHIHTLTSLDESDYRQL